MANNAWIEEVKREQARRDAKNLRYQKPISKELNYENIVREVWDIAEACSEVQWMTEDEERIDNLFDGDTEQAWEFRLAFSDLQADCGQMINDLNRIEIWDGEEGIDSSDIDGEYIEPGDNVPTIFDWFFPAIECDDLMGYDSYEHDYFGLSRYEMKYSQRTAKKRVMRLTKEELLEDAAQCMRIARQYLALKYRYANIKAAIDILAQEQLTTIRIVRGIEEAYEKAEEETNGFKRGISDNLHKLDRMLNELPERFWIE